MENKNQIDYWSKEVERLFNEQQRCLATGMTEEDMHFRVVQCQLKMAVDELQFYLYKEEGN
jgi:hypothetical protein